MYEATSAGPTSLGGRCLCGRARFELTEPARTARYCHCTRCQRRTGTASSAQAQIEGTTLGLVQGAGLVRAWRHPDDGFDGDPGERPSWRGWVANAAVWEEIPEDGLERLPQSRP